MIHVHVCGPDLEHRYACVNVLFPYNRSVQWRADVAPWPRRSPSHRPWIVLKASQVVLVRFTMTRNLTMMPIMDTAPVQPPLNPARRVHSISNRYLMWRLLCLSQPRDCSLLFEINSSPSLPQMIWQCSVVRSHTNGTLFLMNITCTDQSREGAAEVTLVMQKPKPTVWTEVLIPL